nr:MAG TPA: hypothetical protein [Caudoviricetes sp.]
MHRSRTVFYEKCVSFSVFSCLLYIVYTFLGVYELMFCIYQFY